MTTSAKLLLLSIVILSIIVPARAASDKNPARGLRKALVNMTVVCLLYVLAIRFIYPRLL